MVTIRHRVNGDRRLAEKIVRLEEHHRATHDARSQQDEVERLWRLLPTALQQYFWAIDDGRDSPDAQWLLERAMYLVAADHDPLRPTCGWVLRHAWNKLGFWHARNLYAVRGMNLHDRVTAELAAQELLGSDQQTLHRLWVDDEDGDEWLRLWREQGTRDADVLERSGLDEPALELLESAMS